MSTAILSDMTVLSFHALATSGWLAIQSLPLLFTPSLITTLLAREPHKITDLEVYLCRSLGLISLGFALLQLLLSGLVPLRIGQKGTSSESTTTKSPFVRASITITTIYFALAAFYAYTQLTYSFSFAFGVGVIGDTALFCLGLWVLLFGNEKARLSKSTGADKRTSNYPFENSSSARDAKKREKEREKEKDSKSSGKRSILRRA